MLNVNSVWLLPAGAGLQAAADANQGEALASASTELVWNYDILGRLCILFVCGLAAKQEPPATPSQDGCDRANAAGAPLSNRIWNFRFHVSRSHTLRALRCYVPLGV